MHIEPSLQSVIDSHVKTSLATFGRNKDEQVMQKTALVAFAGLGLARAVLQNGETTWVKTDRLKELETSPTAPVDLSKVMTPVAEGAGEPKLTGSLKLLIEDVIATARERDPETAWNFDGILLWLAEQGLATVGPINGDEWIWRADPTLIDCYKMGKKGNRGIGIVKKPKIRMDETLEAATEPMVKLLEVQHGTKLDHAAKRLGTISMLLCEEITGDAIAYKDNKGRLAWKASEKLQLALIGGASEAEGSLAAD